MFEREIKFIYDFNLNKINRLGPYFTFEQLLSTDVHPAILQYISAEIDYLIFEDRQKLLKNSVFDYSGEKISYYFNQISEEVKKTKRFSLEYIAKLVMHASSFTVNYLIHPKWTLTKFVFDEDKHKSTNEIKQILNYVYYYKYISKILVTYINAKKILSMNAQEFENLLDKADRLGIESNLHEIILNSLRSMAEFLNIGEIKKTKIPLGAVELFLEEKELTKHLQKVTQVFGSDENAKFNVIDYQKVLGSVMLEIHEPEPESVEEEEFEQEEIKDVSYPDKTEEQVSVEEEVHTEQDEIVVIEPVDANIKTSDDIEEKVYDKNIVEENESEPDLEDDKHELMNEKEQEQEKEKELKPEKEIVFSQPTKIKIHFDDEIRLEPVLDNDNSAGEDSKINEQVKEEIEKEPGRMEEDESTEEEITIEGLRNPFDEDEAEIEFQKELELAQGKIDKELDNVELPESKPEDSIEEEPDEEESLSFIIKHKNDELIKEQEHEKEQEQEITKANNVENLSAKNFDYTADKMKDLNKEIDEGNIEHHDLELAEILERKEMTTIIDVIFDYDIENFASLLDEISLCKNVEEAHQIINQALTSRDIDKNSEEAESFRTIVSEFFRQK